MYELRGRNSRSLIQLKDKTMVQILDRYHTLGHRLVYFNKFSAFHIAFYYLFNIS